MPVRNDGRELRGSACACGDRFANPHRDTRGRHHHRHRAPTRAKRANTFQGRVVDLKREGITVIVNVDARVLLEVHITPGALEELQLEPGKMVWLVIKTYSCNLVEPAKVVTRAEEL